MAELSSCENCGGPVNRHKALDGTRYITPIDVHFLSRHPLIDMFIYDRLRRAEKIIEELRQQLADK